MALPKLTINIKSDGLGRVGGDSDSTSAMILYNNNIADLTGIFDTQNFGKFTKLSEVEAVGITATSTNFKKEHYYISEFFRIQPNADLWVGVFPIPVSGNTFSANMTEVMLGANKVISQFAVINDTKVLSGTEVAALQTVGSNFESQLKVPVSILYAADTSTLTYVTLPDLASSSSKYVSVVLGGGSESLTTSNAKLVSMIGAVLGCVSKAKVAESIMWVGKFNISDGSNLETPFVYLDLSGTPTQITYNDLYVASKLDTLNDKRYIFGLKHNIPGSYLNNDHTSIVATDDFAYIYAVRPINKAYKLIDQKMIVELGRPLQLEAGGVLSTGTQQYFINTISTPLTTMVNNNEISDYDVFIDPTQNVASTETINIEVSILPVGSAKYITISLGYSLTV